MPKTLLLADDSVVIQKLVALSFANENVELITVYNGDDALQRVRETLPDLVLADVVMPGKNGYEVCHAIKQDSSLQHIPVLLLTGTFEAFDEKLAAQVGSNGQITKPFEAQALVERVNQLLASTPPAPAAPVAASSPEAGPDDTFDFFDEEIGGAAPANPSLELDPPAGPDPLAGVGNASDDFATEDLLEAPTRATAASVTQPVQPADQSSRVIGGGPVGQAAPPSPPANPADPGATIVAGDLSGDPAGDPFAPLASADPGATVVAGSDAASSIPPMASADPEATVVAELFDPPPAVPAAADPGATVVAEAFQAPPALPSAADPGATVIAEAVPESDFDVSTSDLGDSFAPEPPPETPPHAAGSGYSSHSDAPQGSGQSVAAAAGLSAVMRERIHETLEKVAWEAFADLSEIIVRQVLERVEQVAWDVIPEMAEVVIQEEIRRMKGERES